MDPLLVARLESLGGTMGDNGWKDPGHGSLYKRYFPTWFDLNYPAQVGLDDAKDYHDDAGHGPVDKDAECDTEKGPQKSPWQEKKPPPPLLLGWRGLKRRVVPVTNEATAPAPRRAVGTVAAIAFSEEITEETK
jgi:hypothetical protein